MTKSELENYRERLLRLGNRIKGDVSSLASEALRKAGGAASGNLSNTPMHLADLSADNFDQEVVIGLLENEEQTLEEIAAALERVRQGTYGECEECHKPISKERLNAIPYTRLCVNCARQAENGGTHE